MVRCRYQAESRAIPGKYEKKRGADGALIPLSSLHVRVLFWLNEVLVGAVDDVAGPGRFAFQFQSQVRLR